MEEYQYINMSLIIYLNIITHENTSYNSNTKWVLLQDLDFQQKSSFIINTKDKLTDMVITFVNKFHSEGENLMIFHCNNNGLKSIWTVNV